MRAPRGRLSTYLFSTDVHGVLKCLVGAVMIQPRRRCRTRRNDVAMAMAMAPMPCLVQRRKTARNMSKLQHQMQRCSDPNQATPCHVRSEQANRHTGHTVPLKVLRHSDAIHAAAACLIRNIDANIFKTCHIQVTQVSETQSGPKQVSTFHARRRDVPTHNTCHITRLDSRKKRTTGITKVPDHIRSRGAWRAN